MDHSTHTHAAAAAIDPVCGMTVDPAKSPHRHSHEQQTYHFCSAGCRGKFAADPDKYLHGARAEPAADAKNTVYTCPMHPEVRQVGPGSCPICGMALEPEAGGADDGGELADMMRRLWISTLLALPVVALDIGGHFGLWHLPGNISASCRVGAGNAGGAVGRLAVLRARRPVARHAQPQYVHADRHGHRRRLWLQHRGGACARAFSRARSTTSTAASRSISRPRPSSPCWCCSARCWSCARGLRPRARSARCSRSRPRPRGASRTTAAMRTWRSTTSPSATGCGFAPAKRFRSTATWSRADPRSTNRWSPAKRCR